MKEFKDDIRARVILKDGREVWRDGEGQIIDVDSGEILSISGDVNKPASGDSKTSSRRHLMAVVQSQKEAVEDVYDAWGHIVGVQAKIALAGDGAKATAAAKFVAKATGLLDEEENEKQDRDVFGKELADEVLAKVRGVLGDRNL